MHYNHFSIDYIEAISRNLKIGINERGEPTYFPDLVSDSDILNLKNDLQSIWSNSASAIEVVRSKKDSNIQSGLFGLVNELEKAFKVGFLISDRVVLVDYLFERLLTRKAPGEIDRTHLGVIASSLVAALPLVKAGRVVIIPSPFSWHLETKRIIAEAADKTHISIELMSLLNMLSITKHCRLHPFTIAESDANYSSIIDSQIDKVDAIGRDGAAYAYDGILGALISEKLLNEVELSVSPSIALRDYVGIIDANSDFRRRYLDRIIKGGSLASEVNVGGIRGDLLKVIDEKNEVDFRVLAKMTTTAGTIGGATIGLLSAVTVVSAPLVIAGAVLGLSTALTGLINSKDANEDIVISVFKKLHNA